MPHEKLGRTQTQTQGANGSRHLNCTCRYDALSRARYIHCWRAMSSITRGSRVQSLLNSCSHPGNVSGRFYIWSLWKGGRHSSLAPWKLKESGRHEHYHFLQSVFVISLECFTRIKLGFMQSSIHWREVSIWKMYGWRKGDVLKRGWLWPTSTLTNNPINAHDRNICPHHLRILCFSSSDHSFNTTMKPLQNKKKSTELVLCCVIPFTSFHFGIRALSACKTNVFKTRFETNKNISIFITTISAAGGLILLLKVLVS